MTHPDNPPPPGGPGRDDYLKVAEVAELLHIDVKSAYTLIYDGELPYSDLRRKGAKRARIRVRRATVHAFAASRERGGAAA